MEAGAAVGCLPPYGDICPRNTQNRPRPPCFSRCILVQAGDVIGRLPMGHNGVNSIQVMLPTHHPCRLNATRRRGFFMRPQRANWRRGVCECRYCPRRVSRAGGRQGGRPLYTRRPRRFLLPFLPTLPQPATAHGAPGPARFFFALLPLCRLACPARDCRCHSKRVLRGNRQRVSTLPTRRPRRHANLCRRGFFC